MLVASVDSVARKISIYNSVQTTSLLKIKEKGKFSSYILIQQCAYQKTAVTPKYYIYTLKAVLWDMVVYTYNPSTQ